MGVGGGGGGCGGGVGGCGGPTTIAPAYTDRHSGKKFGSKNF